jgi:hypothetical protein
LKNVKGTQTADPTSSCAMVLVDQSSHHIAPLDPNAFDWALSRTGPELRRLELPELVQEAQDGGLPDAHSRTTKRVVRGPTCCAASTGLRQASHADARRSVKTSSRASFASFGSRE